MCGGNEQGRKIHIINWEQLCKPTKLGGMGLKKAGLMNMAFLAKARLENDPKALGHLKSVVDF